MGNCFSNSKEKKLIRENAELKVKVKRLQRIIEHDNHDLNDDSENYESFFLGINFSLMYSDQF
mgnify:CR=1 FL=1